MASSQRKHDRVGFVVCTSLALGIIVVMWVWSVRAIVGQGVRGTKQMVSEVSDTAGSVRRQSAPDPETVAEIKEQLKGIVTKNTDDAAAPETTTPLSSEASQEAKDGSTIDAIAQLMKHDVETYGEEPKN